MNDNGAGGQQGQGSLEEEARRWFVAMRGEPGGDTRAAFGDWLAASPAHEAAYRRAAASFAKAEVLKGSARFGAQRPRHGAMFLSPRRAAIAATLVAAAVVALVYAAHSAPSGTAPAGTTSPQTAILAHAEGRLATRRGEIRSFRLTDGSMAILDTDSAAEVSMTQGERRLHLLQGRARLDVRQDARPFRIEAGAGLVTAREALIDIGYADSQVRVDLIGGSADVRPALQHAAYVTGPKTLLRGSSFGFGVGDFALPGKIRQKARQEEWPSGWVEYRAIALADLVEQANRYARKPIVLDDPETGRLSASGRFRIADTEGFVDNIAALFGLAVTVSNDGIHLHRK